MKKNQAAPQAGEVSKLSRDTTGENKFTADGLQSLTNNMVKEKVVIVKKEKMVVKKKQVAGSSAAPDKSKSETSSDVDTRSLVALGAAKTCGAGAKCKLVLAPSKSESTVSIPLLEIKKKQRTQRPKMVNPKPSVEEKSASKDLPLVVRTKPEKPAQQYTTYGSGMVFAPMEI
ncbi:protein argonaute 1 [Dorcoceras hygrometricum]|uniref:Protein argonaute 1 n=1 Tax=Dorcoceras hygrometricum TaxID=472368 RepID=A0A2Z7B9B9_9LAMI|nr:protein argonaute 1 [Dorcoceras hygrometricum]